MFVRMGRRSLDFARRAIAFCALAGFVAGTTGLPMPRVSLPGKDRSKPFPCQDRQCGCASAEQCWRGCCCFTNREKLAWAAKHGVTPPDYVFAAAERERPATAVASCCSARRGTSCCERASTCCDARTGKAEVSAPLVTVEFVLAVQARKCQGQAELWLAMGAVALPPASVTLTLDSPICGDAVVSGPTLVGVTNSPESPPPRA